MPIPVAPLIRITLRAGAVLAAAYAAKRVVLSKVFHGRTDQRAEDAFDDLGEGVALHRPNDRAGDKVTQTNTTARLNREIRIGKRRYKIDAAVMTRFRIQRG